MAGTRSDGDPEQRRPAAVMRDVAKLAGVSHQTVSRVLNDHASVRPETRHRVLQAMKHLDYQRNTAARALVTRRSQTLGLVTIDTPLVGPASMVYGIEQAARDAGYFVSIVSVRSPERTSLIDAIKRLREQSVEGIIAIAPEDSAVEALSNAPDSLPIVGVGVGQSPDVPMVGVDNTAGASMIVSHLIELGHRVIAHVRGPESWPEAKERMAGWRQALASASVQSPQPLVGDWSPRSGYQAGHMIARDPTITAVFCANDQMALGAISALHQSGRRVPQDVSVVGFDDIPEAAYLFPPLTTIRQDFSAIGRHSFAMLVQQIAARRRSAERVLLPPTMVVRDSTAPARQR